MFGFDTAPLFEITRMYLMGFGVITVLGGVMGFVKAKSRASLIAGGISGALLFATGWLMLTYGRSATILGLVVSLALAVRFSRAYVTSKKIMPAGVMAGLGIVGVVLTALALRG